MITYFPHILKSRLVVSLFLLLLLAGCGQAPSSPQTQKRSDPPSLVGKSVDFDLGGRIHVHSASGFVCHARTDSSDLSPLPGALVLPSVWPTYDQGTLQTAKNYVTAVLQTFSKANSQSTATHIDTLPYPPFSADTKAFQLWAVGAVHNGCSETLQITNNGQTNIQISQISVRYTTDTQTVHQQYNLIDVCSLLSLAPPCPGAHGGGETGYSAEIDLRPGKTNTIIAAQPFWNSMGESPVLTLKPGDIVEVVISYVARNNLSFSLLPSFTLNWSNKSVTYPVPQLQTSFVLASQFSCYRLQGQQFIQASPDSENAGLWCV